MFPRASSRELSLLHELAVSDVRVVWYAAKQSFGDIPSQAELGTEDKPQPPRDQSAVYDFKIGVAGWDATLSLAG